jgi:dihydrofolate reductase
MRKIIVTEFVSVDGVMEDPGGSENFAHGGWSFKFNDPEGGKFKLDETMATDALLLGRVTYEGFAEAWPERTDDAGFADKFNSMPKYVVSSTLTNPTWNNTTVLSGDAIEEVTKLKQTDGGDIAVHGSLSLAAALLEADLVDQLNLMIHPIVLGSGKRLFPTDGGTDRYPKMLELAECRQLSSGSLIVIYRRAAA